MTARSGCTEKCFGVLSRTRPLRTHTPMSTTRKRNPNRGATQARNAERHKCPKCGRKAALVIIDIGVACRWVGCGYVGVAERLFDETCSQCGNETLCRWSGDPVADEYNASTAPAWWCRSCYEDRASDI